MNAFQKSISAADKFYWDAMEVLKTEGPRRVRCRHCQMVKDLGRMENPKSAFEKIEHHMRHCGLMHAAVQIQKIIKEHA